MKTLLEGLDELGFSNLEGIDVPQIDNADEESDAMSEEAIAKMADCIYDKKFCCPVCDAHFTDKAVKSAKVRLLELDVDLMPKYTPLNPFYYNVVICTSCGYAALADNFDKLTEAQGFAIKKEISKKYLHKSYTFPLTESSAVERYKYTLLNTVVKKGRVSEMAYICLVISWIYKIDEDEENRRLFVGSAYKLFIEAFGKESFPFFGLSETATQYLIAELAWYLKDQESSKKWLSRVLSSRSSTSKVKELALDLKNRITGQP